MNEYIYPLLISFIAGIATIIGNLLLFINPKYKEFLISFALGLSFSVMFLISVLDLIPEGLRYGLGEVGESLRLFIFSLILLLFGYIIVVLIERKIKSNDSLYKIGVLSMISLLIHNIPEGILCALTSSVDIKIGLKFSLIIMIHNIPEGICISLPIYYATKSKLKALFYTFISSMGEFIGAILALILLRPILSNMMLYIILVLVAGIMISLSVFKILKEGLLYKRYKYLIWGIILGIVVVYLTL